MRTIKLKLTLAALLALLLPGALLAAEEAVAPAQPAAEPAAAAVAPEAKAKADALAAAEKQAREDRITLSLGFDLLDLTGPGYFLMPYADDESHPLARFYLLRTLPGDAWIKATAGYDGSDESGALYDADVHVAQPGGYEAGITAQRFTRNHPHLTLPPAAAGTLLGYASTDLDPGARYEREQEEISAFGRVKFPDYPAHVRLALRQYRSGGSLQQIFLDEGCTGGAGACHVISQKREIDSVTRDLSAGLDAHVGLVDLGYTFLSSTFKDDAPEPSWAYSVGGVRPHNVYPDTRFTANTLAVSTNNTGRITASLGLAAGKRENRDVDLSETVTHLDGELAWRPLASLAMVFKGRRNQREQDAGPGVAASRLAGGLPVEPEITEDTTMATVTYRPASSFRLRGDLSRDEIKRDGMAGWSLPEEGTTDRWRIAAEGHPGANFDIQASYQELTTDNPSYPSSPTAERRMGLTAGWAPRPDSQLLSTIQRTRGENVFAGRTNERTLFHNSLSFNPVQAVTCALLFDHFVDEVSGDLAFGNLGPTLVIDHDASYRAQGSQLLVNAGWQATKTLTLSGELSWLTVEGNLRVTDSGYSDVGSWSAMDAVQQGAALGLKLELADGWGVSSRLAFAEFTDHEGNAADEKLTEVSALVSKSW